MKALVTGGGGFLGSCICRMLIEQGAQVWALGRRAYPHLEKLGVRTLRADIRDAAALESAAGGVDVVLHTAALAGVWGKRRHFWQINVEGTRNVIRACRRRQVARLVYTSTPSVVSVPRDLCGVDESAPYPRSYLADYPETKAVAEREVLAANDENLQTVSLRPHLIWGPGDPHLFPRIVDRAARGRLVQVGEGDNLVDVTYIDNAARAHLLACEALCAGKPCAGKAYFISQGEPVRLWPWLHEILAELGLRGHRRTLSYKTARRLGACLEGLYRLLRISAEPPLTRFVAAQLAHSHYFDISAARNDLGYYPAVSTSEGTRRLIADLKPRLSHA